MGYQTAEAMVVRKGYSVEQLRECLEEYADLSVVQVRRALALLLLSLSGPSLSRACWLVFCLLCPCVPRSALSCWVVVGFVPPLLMPCAMSSRLLRCF